MTEKCDSYPHSQTLNLRWVRNRHRLEQDSSQNLALLLAGPQCRHQCHDLEEVYDGTVLHHIQKVGTHFNTLGSSDAEKVGQFRLSLSIERRSEYLF